jgi:two-component system competent response regulator ComA
MDKLINIHIINNCETFSYGIKYLIEKEKEFKIIGISRTIDEGIKDIKLNKPSILILDLYGSLNDKCTLINKLDNFKNLNIKVVVTIERYYKDLFEKLIYKNTKGFFTKETKISQIITLLRSVANEQIVISEELTKSFINLGSHQSISTKELKILELISKEKTNKEIADILNYSKSTVEYYITNIINKLSVTNRIGAVNKAKKLNLL